MESDGRMAIASAVAAVRITPRILSLIAEIDEFKGAWRAIGRIAPDRLTSLRRVATIESIGSSTRIEGARLSNLEIEKLLSNLQLRSFATRDEQEVAGYADVMETVFEHWADIPVNENHIRQLHRDLLAHSPKDERHRGAYKTITNHVEAFDETGNSLGIVFATATPFETPRLMEELTAWLSEALDSKLLHPLLVIAVFIVVFLEIHPFQDGNGRLGWSATSHPKGHLHRIASLTALGASRGQPRRGTVLPNRQFFGQYSVMRDYQTMGRNCGVPVTKESKSDLEQMIRAMPRGLIGIDGYHGAGKSFLASSLSEALDVPCVHVDEFVDPSWGRYVKSLQVHEFSTALQPRPIIVEGVCLLADLDLVGLKPDLLIYIEGDEPDPATARGRGALADEVRQYHREWRPTDVADVLFSGGAASKASNLSSSQIGVGGGKKTTTQVVLYGDKRTTTQGVVGREKKNTQQVDADRQTMRPQNLGTATQFRFQAELQERRERVRTRLTYGLVGAYVIFTFILIVSVVYGLVDFNKAKDIFSTFLTPILGLAGSSLGFYFGVSVYDDIRNSKS
jgi:hypothetical protein